MGVDTYLRVAAVWKNLPHPLDRDTAMDFLCPILAVNPAEQKKFRHIFPDYAHLLGLKEEPGIGDLTSDNPPNEIGSNENKIPEKENPHTIDQQPLAGEKREPSRMRYRMVTLLSLLFLSGLTYFAYPKINVALKRVFPSTGVNPRTDNETKAPSPSSALGQNKPWQDITAFFGRNKAPFSLALYVFLLIGLLGFYVWMRARRRYAARQERGEEPPYQLPIKINRNSAIAVAPKFMGAVNRLRGREVSGRLRINLPRTVAATVRRGGLIDFRFDAFSRPVEYLLLIDKNSEQNHQAQLFEFIYQHLRRQEVQAGRFFFDGVPLWCWNERYPEGLSLARLKHLYRDARLIVLSNGYGFISAVTGELEAWTGQLAGWDRRALLTPAPLAGWNYHEATLARFFQVLPTSAEGIAQAVRYFENLPTPGLRDWKYEIGADDRPVDIDPEQVSTSLSAHFPAAMIRWISACAIYPELHWDLTLRIGEVLSSPGDPPLVTYEHVAALARLPWFRHGYMPNAARSQLLEFKGLSEDDKNSVRKAVVDVLEANIPENQKSYAYEEHQLHLAINQLLLARIPEDKQRWLRRYRELHARGVKGDHVSIVELDRRFNRILDFPLPQRLRGFLFPEGRGVLGLLNPANLFTAKKKAVKFSQRLEEAPVPKNMVFIPGGTFQMGDVMGDKEETDETVHGVTLGAFQIGAYEVTFEEYDAFCTATKREKPADEGWGRGKRPVINVSWEDVVAYCNWRSRQEGLREVYTISGSSVSANWQANGYRLPTEAEWEYAARAGGKKVRFGNGKDIADPKEINFYGDADYKKPYSVAGEFPGKSLPVGSFSPNALGLYDMSGNVWEWCWDWYGSYPTSAQINPKGPNIGSYRVMRGGSWSDGPQNCRVAFRNRLTPGNRGNDIGFRLSRTL